MGTNRSKDLKKPSEELISAIHKSFNNSVSVITGEGGTGKTLAIQIIHKICNTMKIGFRVCSFTGKAIANIKEDYDEHWRRSL